MKVWHAPERIVMLAAKKAGVEVVNYRILTDKRVFSARFTLSTEYVPNRRRKARFRKLKERYVWNAKKGENEFRLQTSPGKVCWHGHRDFMRELFRLWPTARLKSVVEDYRGLEDFERKYASTEGKDTEYFGSPMGSADLCSCDLEEDPGLAA